MDIGAAFVTGGESAVRAVKPGEGALDDPAMAPELDLGLDAAPCDARYDAADMAAGSAEDVVVGLVRVRCVFRGHVTGDSEST